MTDTAAAERRELEHKPPDSWVMKFCMGCGQNGLVRPLNARHYWFGKQCSGKIIEVTYRRAALGETK